MNSGNALQRLERRVLLERLDERPRAGRPDVITAQTAHRRRQSRRQQLSPAGKWMSSLLQHLDGAIRFERLAERLSALGANVVGLQAATKGARNASALPLGAGSREAM